jgi:hypothetical protein
MKRFILAAAVSAVAFLPIFASGAADTSMSAVGAGANGYDWLVGTWTCTNTMAASRLGSLPSTPATVTKLRDGNILVRTMSPNGDVTAYYAYLPKTKVWYSPFADSSGYYGYESSAQSGKTIQFSGMFYMTSGAPVPIRDTYTMLSMRKYYDLSEAKVAGAWKATAKSTCTKS